jgi:hypothetical protein
MNTLTPNGCKSGLDAESQLVPGESREDFARLQTDYYRRFHPVTPETRFQVDNLVRNEWLLRRLHRVEAQLWQFHAGQAAQGTGHELGEAWAKADAQFMRLQRRVTAAEKAYKAAKVELDRLQADEIATETEEMASFLKAESQRREQGTTQPQSPSPTAADQSSQAPRRIDTGSGTAPNRLSRP